MVFGWLLCCPVLVICVAVILSLPVCLDCLVLVLACWFCVGVLILVGWCSVVVLVYGFVFCDSMFCTVRVVVLFDVPVGIAFGWFGRFWIWCFVVWVWRVI